MTKRRIQLFISLALLTLSFFTIFWFFSPLKAQLSPQDYTALLYRPSGFARYLVIPKVSDFYRQAKKNPVLKNLFVNKGFTTFFSSPPPQLLNDVFLWLSILPENLEKALLGAIFPGALVYVSSEMGSILIVEVSPAGKILLEKTNYPHKTFKESYFILASNDSLLKKQKAHEAKVGKASLNISNQELAIIFDPEDNPNKEEVSLTWALYRTFFPKNRVGAQTFVISPQENSIKIRSLAPLSWPVGDKTYQNFLNSLGTPNSGSGSVLEQGIVLQFMGDISSLETFISKDEFMRSSFDLPIVLFSGFLVDRGRFLPQLAIKLDRREKKLVEFLQEAFYFKETKETKGAEGETILSYSSQDYYPLEKAGFRVHYLFGKKNFYWASSGDSFKLLRQWEKENKKKEERPALEGEKALLYFKGNLHKILKSLLNSLNSSEPSYGEGAFFDFKETLAQWLKSIRKAQIEGAYYISPTHLRGDVQVLF